MTDIAKFWLALYTISVRGIKLRSKLYFSMGVFQLVDLIITELDLLSIRVLSLVKNLYVKKSFALQSKCCNFNQ